ncbi:MAG: sigma-54-dependent transcriptional regulator [Planctomycetota bacterium]
MKPQRRVLVIDDEKNFADMLGTEIARMGFATTVVHEGPAAIELLARVPVDVVVTDLKMPGMTGIEAIARIRQMDDPPEIIVLTGHATVETALDAMKAGAYDYLTKPCKLDELEVVLHKALEKLDAIRDRRVLRQFLADGPPGLLFVGASTAIQKVLGRIDRVAASADVPVLILGESGTGKELAARRVHQRSPLAAGPFVTVNCAVLQSPVLESELFGHEKGAFTGATQRKLGLFEVAKGGSLFLDEVGEIAEPVQAKLLRAVQFGEYRRVGGTETLNASVRIIAATNRDLQQAVAEGKFREDLYYRLNVVQVEMPPLRDRPEDILPLALHFLERYRGSRESAMELSPTGAEVLQRHPWPGNVRELESLVRRLLILADGPIITAQDIEESFGWPAADANQLPRTLLLEEVERDHILRVLKLCNGNKTETAQKLGIALKTLYNKLNAYRDQGVVE